MLTVNPYNRNQVNFQAQLKISQLSKNLPDWKNAVKDFSHLTARYPDYTVSLNEKNNHIVVKELDKITKKPVRKYVFEKTDGIHTMLEFGVRYAVRTLKAVLKKVTKEKRFEEQAYAFASKFEKEGNDGIVRIPDEIININSLDDINETLAANSIVKIN